MDSPKRGQIRTAWSRFSYLIIGAGVWSLVIGLSVAINLGLDRRAIRDLAVAQARVAYQDLAMAMSPFMNRSAHTRGDGKSGFHAHLAALDAESIAGQSDEWEKRALGRIRKGQAEVAEVTTIGGLEYLRFMRPLVVEKQCLGCHEGRGFALGEVRAGMSLALPMAPLREAHGPSTRVTLGAFGVIWLIGLSAWAFGSSVLQRRARDLQESERTFRELFDHAPVAYHELDMEGRVLRVNEAECELLGYRADEILGRPIFEFVAGPDQAASRGSVMRKLTGEQPLIPVERRYLRRDGSELTLEIHDHLVRSRDGAVEGLRSTLLDITPRVKAERALRDREETLQSVCGSALDAIVMMDGAGCTVMWNPAAERVFGYTSAEMLGRPIHDVLATPSLRSQFLASHPMFRATGKGAAVGKVVELTARRKDGVEIPVELSLSAVRKGEEWFAVGVIRDMTERKQAEERIRSYVGALESARTELEQRAHELLLAKEAAEGANRAKSEFLANMSHEIRTPMNGVLGMAELALESGLSAEQHDYVSMVKSSGESLLSVINDILDFSKIEAGKLDLDPVDFCVHDCVIDALRVIAPKAHDKGLELVCELDEALPEMMSGDALRLRQVLVNLANNAVKFTERGEVAVSARVDGALVRFSVRDTGIGIAPEKQAAVFLPFCQADCSTTRKFGGTGLGLSICAQLTSLMGGRIWLESELGKGTTVYFTVRLQPASVSAKTQADDPSMPDELKVLVVDDNETNRCILDKQLRRWGAVPVIAGSGLQALEILGKAARPFGLIITDCHMPEMDGFQLVQQVHANWPHYKGRVLMLSSASSVGDSARCLEVGVTRHVIKPVRGSDLLAAIRQMLGAVKSLAHLAQAVQPSSGPAAPQAGPRLRVLLADDNAMNQRVARFMLERAGHLVTVANDGNEAVQCWEAGSFDLILMDVQMPEMNGFEATAAIRAKGGKTPIIALTAHAMTGDRDLCLNHGMDGYLQKPIQTKELLALVDRYCVAVTT